MTRDVLIVVSPRDEIDRDLTKMGPHPQAIVVDATDGVGKDEQVSGAELIARKLNDHRVVRALVVLPKTGANVPICGDDADAKHTVDRMFGDAGCLTTDRGPLSAARQIEPQRASAA
jgi:predicted dinucleotide-binding enzyme